MLCHVINYVDSPRTEIRLWGLNSALHGDRLSHCLPDGKPKYSKHLSRPGKRNRARCRVGVFFSSCFGLIALNLLPRLVFRLELRGTFVFSAGIVTLISDRFGS